MLPVKGGQGRAGGQWKLFHERGRREGSDKLSQLAAGVTVSFFLSFALMDLLVRCMGGARAAYW